MLCVKQIGLWLQQNFADSLVKKSHKRLKRAPYLVGPGPSLCVIQTKWHTYKKMP